MNPNKILQFAPIPKAPKPPKHLSTASKKWFREVVGALVMEPSDLLVLARAAEQLDLAEEARKVIATEGKFLRDDCKGTLFAHPAVKIQKDATMLAARLIRDLHLDAPPARPVGRPPGCGIPQRKV